MRFLFPAMFMLLLSGVSADAVVVRTGDHETFTRVVVPVPAGGSWQLQREGNIISVQLTELRSDLDISTVFDRIGQDRISAVTVTGATLQIDLNCRCVVESFVTAPRLLVIDVLDENEGGTTEPPFDESFVTILPPDPVVDVLDTADQDGTVSADDRRRARLPETPEAVEQGNTGNVPDRPAVFSGRSFLEEFGRATNQEDATAAALAEGLGAALGQALTQARDDGVLSANSDVPVEAEPTTAWQIRPVFEGASDPSRVVAPQGSAPSFACIPDDTVDVTNWTTSDDFLTELSTAQVAVFDVNGRADPEAAASLAKVYLRFGMPSEARDVLRWADTDDEETWLVHAMAELMSDQRGDASNRLQRFVTCPSDVAFWAFLAASPDTDLSGMDHQAVLRGFYRLPVEVRAILADQFQSKLRMADLSDLAEEARLSGITNPDRVVLPDPDGVADLLEDNPPEIEGEMSQSPDESIPLFDVITEVSTAWEGGSALRPESVELVASYGTEHRGTDFAPVLNLTTLRAYLLSGRFDDAFSTLISSDFGETRVDAVESFVLRMQEDLSGFDLAKFQYQLGQSDIGADFGLDPLPSARVDTAALNLNEPDPKAVVSDEDRALGGEVIGLPSLERTAAVLQESLALRDTIRDMLFSE